MEKLGRWEKPGKIKPAGALGETGKIFKEIFGWQWWDVQVRVSVIFFRLQVSSFQGTGMSLLKAYGLIQVTYVGLGKAFVGAVWKAGVWKLNQTHLSRPFQDSPGRVWVTLWAGRKCPLSPLPTWSLVLPNSLSPDVKLCSGSVICCEESCGDFKAHGGSSVPRTAGTEAFLPHHEILTVIKVQDGGLTLCFPSAPLKSWGREWSQEVQGCNLWVCRRCCAVFSPSRGDQVGHCFSPFWGVTSHRRLVPPGQRSSWCDSSLCDHWPEFSQGLTGKALPLNHLIPSDALALGVLCGCTISEILASRLKGCILKCVDLFLHGLWVQHFFVPHEGQAFLQVHIGLIISPSFYLQSSLMRVLL